MAINLSVRRLEIAILIFLACLGCIDIPESERAGLPPSAADHVCPAEPLHPDVTEYQTPTRRLFANEIPEIRDDLDFEGMELVLERQLERFAKEKLNGIIIFGEDRYSVVRVRDSLKAFQRLIRRLWLCRKVDEKSECQAQFNHSVKEEFAFYKPNLAEGDPRYGEERPALFTGYYTPSLKVSRVREGEYQYPIYSKPTQEWHQRRGRYEIDFREAIAGQGLELFFAKSRFDLYLLHLEGGGRVFYKDERGNDVSTYISYAGSNSRQWRFINVKMLDRNWIQEPAVTYQRAFIDANPQLEPDIFSYCPSYVYFKTTNHPPEGNRQVSLTDNRSIATDINYYRFKGVLGFVQSERPRAQDKEIEMMPFSRFVVDQDTGGAIRGKARVDFYLGEGSYAELAANTMKQRGDVFFLMLKP